MRSITLLLTATALIAGCDRPSTPQGQANDAAAPSLDEAANATPVTAASGAPAATGKVDRAHKGEAAPSAAFAGPDGKPVTIASFVGKPVLLNLWATWCAPCKGEMPTLDAIAGEGKLTVLTVSQDFDGAKAVAPYFVQAKFKALKPYTDTENVLMKAFNSATLPVTVLYDASGKEVWRVTGPMEWTGADARKLLAEAK